MTDIIQIGEPKFCTEFMQKLANKTPLFITVIGNTETGKIAGISAAGANPQITDYTPAADVEYLYYNVCRCIPGIPITPTGIPTPGVVTKAVLDLAKFPTFFVVSGVNVLPDVPYISLGGSAGGDLSKGTITKNVDRVFNNAKIFGENLAPLLDYLVIGESIAGGTTTALGALIGLGYDAFNKVSSSLPENPSDLKTKIVNSALNAHGLKAGELKNNPLQIIEKFGDPMQAAVLGLIMGINSRIPIILAGGTQMVAVAALAKAMNSSLTSNLAIGTTKWIVNDKGSDIRNLIHQIDPKIPILAANFDFSQMIHSGLKVYEQGIVKEGVGCGGCAVAAMIASNNQITIEKIQQRIEANYSELISRK